jgi:hypothetical protein
MEEATKSPEMKNMRDMKKRSFQLTRISRGQNLAASTTGMGDSL